MQQKQLIKIAYVFFAADLLMLTIPDFSVPEI